jgi:hypothetical protein
LSARICLNLIPCLWVLVPPARHLIRRTEVLFWTKIQSSDHVRSRARLVLGYFRRRIFVRLRPEGTYISTSAQTLTLSLHGQYGNSLAIPDGRFPNAGAGGKWGTATRRLITIIQYMRIEGLWIPLIARRQPVRLGSPGTPPRREAIASKTFARD